MLWRFHSITFFVFIQVSLLRVPTSAVSATGGAARNNKSSSSSRSSGRSSWMPFGRKAHSCRERVPEDSTLGELPENKKNLFVSLTL